MNDEALLAEHSQYKDEAESLRGLADRIKVAIYNEMDLDFVNSKNFDLIMEIINKTK